MCDAHIQPDPEPNKNPSSTRRQVLRGAGLLGAAALMPVGGEFLRPQRARAALAPVGLSSVSSAMHVHASFSERQGSWQSQLAEAARTGIDVIWPTDHDWRMAAHTYITELHFKAGESSNGTNVAYSFSTTGTAKSKVGTLATSPTAPDDPNGGVLSVAVTSGTTSAASHRCAIGPADKVLSNLAGETFTVRVRPTSTSRDAWLEVLMNLSYHTSFGGRPAGIYQLSYQIGAVTAGRSSLGIVGTVRLPAPAGQWSTVTLDPVADIAAIWPDLPDPRDNNMYGLWLGATSRNSTPASGYFAYGQFNRTLITGNEPLDTQTDILRNLAPTYPSVTVRRGLEISFNPKHSNWFGGNFQMPNYPDIGTGDITAKSMQLIHSYGGLGSYNHPFGVQEAGLASQATQDANRRTVATRAIGNRAYGADILEVGYHERGKASLETHQALWDTLSRNGIWLTGNGVSDNHSGKLNSWTVNVARNTFATFVWATSRSEVDMLAALSAGKAFCGELGVWGGDIWIEVEGNPMGSISVSRATSRQLTVAVGGLAASQVIEVVRGPVDYAGTGSPDPATRIVTLSAGATTAMIDTSSSCFVRINVLDQGAGRRVAFSNPIWLLRSEPPGGIPANRRAPN